MFLSFTVTMMVSKVAFTQSYKTQQNEILAYNIFCNGLIGGIGGIINKDADDKWHEAFLKNFGKGCLGGLVKYSSKKQAWHLQNPDKNYLAIPNRLYYFLGHSMVMNASKNKGIFDTYYCNLFGTDIRWNLNKKDSGLNTTFQVRLSLMSIGSFIQLALEKNKFNLHKSLEMGLFYFDLKPNYPTHGANIGSVSGIARFNSIAIGRNLLNGMRFDDAVPHEVIHVYQNYDFFPITNFYYGRYFKNKLSQLNWYNTISRFVIADIDVLYFKTAYYFQPQPTYYKNFFEYEAEHFSGRNYLNR